MTIGESWGASAHEQALALPCDELIPVAPLRLHRAVTVKAPPRIVFRWLCQLKLAPYSYDVLDNFARRSPRELKPGTEELVLGERFMSIFRLRSFVTDEQITLQARRTAVTYAVIAEEGSSTRLLARVLFDPPGRPLLAGLCGRALALGDLAMMRKQLLTLGSLAERDARALA